MVEHIEVKSSVILMAFAILLIWTKLNMVERWAIRTTLELAWNKGFHLDIVELNSTYIVPELIKAHRTIEKLHFAYGMCFFLQNWTVEFQHQYRGNTVAGMLGKRAVNTSNIILHFD